MPRGSKSKHTSKQKCQVEHIEEGYESRGPQSRMFFASVLKRSVQRHRQPISRRLPEFFRRIPRRVHGLFGIEHVGRSAV
jgi:hypothetical protein